MKCGKFVFSGERLRGGSLFGRHAAGKVSVRFTGCTDFKEGNEFS